MRSVTSPDFFPLRRFPRCSTRKTERGAGRLKAIVWTLILAAMVYVGVMVIPILVDEYQFQDDLQNIARFASVNGRTPEQIRATVLTEAQKAKLPVTAEDIKVEAEHGNVRINVNYSVTVDLRAYQWTLNFNPAASNNSLL
jgi:Domain of unknown function (DUF4845)